MNKAGLHKLLNLEVNPQSPTFIIYSQKQSERLNYVAKFIFGNVLKVNCITTNNSTEFKNSGFLKINYSDQLFSGAFQILPKSLLFESGINESKPKGSLKNDLIYFFENYPSVKTANFSYDVFASVFYFISRYEEWQAFEADAHDRFEVKSSILFQNNSHLSPVVDIWILELKSELLNFYKEIKFPENRTKIISTIDVDNLYAYKNKGFIRTSGAIIKDFFKLDFENLKNRIAVLLNKKNDPFDIYSSNSEFCFTNKIPLIYFFLFRAGTKYDRTVDPKSTAFKEVFKRVKNLSAHIGLHPSYYSSQNNAIIHSEIKNLSAQTDEPITLARQHYLNFNIKTTPKLLLQNGILADFTMGFASNIGFRAGTSFPFYYYDFDAEKETDLLLVPFCAMDGAFFIYDKVNPEQMLNSLLSLASQVKKVNGLFITVFHERTFSNHLYPEYSRVYKLLHQKLIE